MGSRDHVSVLCLASVIYKGVFNLLPQYKSPVDDAVSVSVNHLEWNVCFSFQKTFSCRSPTKPQQTPLLPCCFLLYRFIYAKMAVSATQTQVVNLGKIIKESFLQIFSEQISFTSCARAQSPASNSPLCLKGCKSKPTSPTSYENVASLSHRILWSGWSKLNLHQ